MERRPKNPLANAETRTVSSGIRPTEGLLSEPSAPPSEQSGTHADYELGQEISRGGMGRIVEAYDRRHDRQVALKLLLHRTESAVLRFRREAWITGRLQHPAIVPLYEAGSLSTGEPFFAMKLVRGSSLAAVIERSKTSAERLTLLPHLIAVAEALACAHGEGILHRDLKPSNVLIGPYGETVVIDWGLAKRVGENLEDAGQASDEVQVEPIGALTAAGRVVGTPRYMAPEQARGEAIDARADVYSLGATLYHALCGEAPPRRNAENARKGDLGLLSPSFSTLTERAPQIPSDLSAIVDKAMAQAPSERYASAMELAEDLKRFASGRLVVAHTYSLRELVVRWISNHRGVVALGAACVIALMVTGTISVRRIAKERDIAEAARSEADSRRQAAIVQRDAAETLVSALVGDLRDQLVPVGKLGVIVSLGERVLEYYRNAAPAQTESNAPVVLRRATAIETLAGAYKQQRQYDKAMAAYVEAVHLCERARELDPDSVDTDFQLSKYENQIGSIEFNRGHLPQSLDAIELSLSALARVRARAMSAEKALDLDAKRAQILNAKSITLRDIGDLRTANETARASAEILKVQAEDENAKAAIINTLGWSFFYGAGIEYQLGESEKGTDDAAASLKLRLRSQRMTPDDEYRKLDVSWSHARIGALHSLAGEDVRAKTEFDLGIRGFTELVNHEPSQVQFHDARGEALLHLCRLKADLGEHVGARRDCLDAIDEYDANVKLAHDSTSIDIMAVAIAALAELEVRAGNHEHAIAIARRALGTNEARDPLLSNASPLNESRAAAHLALARAELADPALHDAAASDALTAVTEWDALLRASPKNVVRATQAIVAHVALADARIATSDTSGANESLETAARTCDAVDPSVNVVDLRLACAEVDAKRASRTTDATRATALREHARAVLATVPPSRIRPIANERWLRDLPR